MRVSTSGSGDLRRIAIGAGLLAGTANVIMQLGHPSVGYGVLESKVDSGNVFKHPVKRARTTLTYLAVATMGTDRERLLYRRAVNRSHVPVRSDASSPVSYNAFDPDLQLWVAACLYRGLEDVHRVLGMRAEPDEWAEIYRRSAVFGTTLQVPAERWPADPEAFERYWAGALERVHIDDTVRAYLTDLTMMRNMPAPVRLVLGRFNRFVTIGFLPPRFRDEMRFDWDARRQRGFERLMAAIGVLVRRLPPPLRAFPLNAVLADLRRRIRTGRDLV